MNVELYHYGLKGMKWGQRRWQYDDGRFNDAGKARYFGQNSSHRPDSVRVLQGDKPKAGSQSGQSQKSDFDKAKAKQVAKNVAIGAAIVGGTVLVAYGGYKIHQAGGFSQVSKNLQEKMRETKLENLKLKQEFKADMASIKSEGKVRLAEIRENTKTDLASIRESGKSKREEIRKVLDENKGNDTRFKPGQWSKNQEKYLNEYLKDIDSYGGKIVNENGRTMFTIPGLKDFKPIDMGSANSNGSVKSASKIVSEYKKEHPNTTLTPSKIVENYQGAAKAVSSTAKSVASSTKTAASTAKSVASSVKSSASNVPKLTLTPDTINAGTNFVAQATKSYATMKQINAENSRSNSKAKKGQKAVDDYTKELLKKGA